MVKEETADNATLVGVIGTVVLVFIMLALYFNQKAMKYIGHLLDDVSDLGSRIGAAKEQVRLLCSTPTNPVFVWSTFKILQWYRVWQ